jgi:superfamily I DNA/RNA helicase
MSCADVSPVSIGDPNQSIYGWRHADPVANARLLSSSFPQREAVRVMLSHNYRCAPAIALAARSLLGYLSLSFWMPALSDAVSKG